MWLSLWMLLPQDILWAAWVQKWENWEENLLKTMQYEDASDSGSAQQLEPEAGLWGSVPVCCLCPCTFSFLWCRMWLEIHRCSGRKLVLIWCNHFWVKYWALTSWERGSVKTSPFRHKKNRWFQILLCTSGHEIPDFRALIVKNITLLCAWPQEYRIACRLRYYLLQARGLEFSRYLSEREYFMPSDSIRWVVPSYFFIWV